MSSKTRIDGTAPTVLELQTTLRTLQGLASSAEAVQNLDARQRQELQEAARLLLGRRPRRPRRTPPLLDVDEEQAALASTKKERQSPCYVCGVVTHVAVDALCAACRASERAAALALAVAHEHQVLRDHVVVVTGGRVNIGFAVARGLLRLGARVVVTTRFAADARARFAACADADVWSARLQIFELDLRDLPGLERLAAEINDELPALDAIIHNAAQTLPLSLAELSALQTQALPSSPSLPSTALQALASLAANPLASSSSQHGPYGRAPDESWRAGVDDVSTRELLEVLLINAAAPFVLTRALLPALRRCSRRPRIVVNVTSSEGRFSFTPRGPADDDDGAELDSGMRGERRGKSTRHPHLNMAKAALNMLTRTSSAELAREEIVMVAVDPGWVSGPLPTGGFANGRFPLDVDEAARRVLHPIISSATGAPPRPGVLYKNYRPAPW